MSSRGGEAPQVKGHRFDEKCRMLLEMLGYKSVLRHGHGFDMIGDPPDRHQSFLRPVFAPQYRTAFEFKSGPDVTISAEARKLHRKILAARRSRRPALRGIKNGILIVESLVPSRTKRKIFADFVIHVWDNPVLLFLASKLSVMRRLLQPERKLREEKLGAWTTTLRVAKTYRNGLRYNVCVFHQHLFDALDRETFERTVALLTQRLESSANELDLRGYVTLEIFALSGATDDCVEGCRKILETFSAGRIIYETGNPHIHSYDTAPWAFLLT